MVSKQAITKPEQSFSANDFIPILLVADSDHQEEGPAVRTELDLTGPWPLSGRAPKSPRTSCSLSLERGSTWRSRNSQAGNWTAGMCSRRRCSEKKDAVKCPSWNAGGEENPEWSLKGDINCTWKRGKKWLGTKPLPGWDYPMKGKLKTGREAMCDCSDFYVSRREVSK